MNNQRMIDKLDEIAHKIEVHLEWSRSDPDFIELDRTDHDEIATTLKYGVEDELAMEHDKAYNKAYWHARHWFERWEDEEYPSFGDTLHDMYPEGIDDGDDLYDED